MPLVPVRNEELARRAFGNAGGQARAKVSEILDLAMMNLYLGALDRHSPQDAAAFMFKLVACDAEVPCVPPWLREVFAANREFLTTEEATPVVVSTPAEVVRSHRPRGVKFVLTAEDVLRIRAEVAQGTKQGALAYEYSVSECLISKIVNRKIWTHI